MNLKGRNFLTLKDFTPEEIVDWSIWRLNINRKRNREFCMIHSAARILRLFLKKDQHTHTLFFEVAAHDLGMGTTYLDPSGSQIGKKESIADTARVLGRMYDGIEYRGFEQSIVEELAKYAGVPVWNGLTNEYHPTQMLADMLTIREHFGYLKDIKLTYMGTPAIT